MRFSQRHGHKPIKSIIQLESMDEDLRNSLWNAVYMHYFAIPGLANNIYNDRDLPQLLRAIWANYFKWQVTSLSPVWSETSQKIHDFFITCPWYEVYDFIEFLANLDHPYYNPVRDRFINSCNNYLQSEVSAYRFIGKKIVPITSPEEISSIEQALRVTNKLTPVYTHLKRALDLFADKKSPDYRNSIKESISAIEALCKLITGKPGISLGNALKEIEAKSKIKIHTALNKSFDSLYGYTSNADGIRHALLEEPNLDSEDAKFMLVSCSAFINYLITKSSKAGIKL